MHTGQPTQYAHAPLTVTMRPITVTKNIETNTINTNREKDDFREYFIAIPVFLKNKDTRQTRSQRT